MVVKKLMKSPFYWFVKKFSNFSKTMLLLLVKILITIHSLCFSLLMCPTSLCQTYTRDSRRGCQRKTTWRGAVRWDQSAKKKNEVKIGASLFNVFTIFRLHFTIKYDYDYFQGTEQSRPRFEGERSRRKERARQKRTCSKKEEATEAPTLARSVVLTSLDEVFGGQSNGLEDVIPVVDDDHDSDAKTSMVSENTSESELSSNDDGPTEDKNPPVAWREPKRGRKIQTTSLLLKRRKKIKQRQKHREPVLKQAYQP